MSNSPGIASLSAPRGAQDDLPDSKLSLINELADAKAIFKQQYCSVNEGTVRFKVWSNTDSLFQAHFHYAMSLITWKCSVSLFPEIQEIWGLSTKFSGNENNSRKFRKFKKLEKTCLIFFFCCCKFWFVEGPSPKVWQNLKRGIYVVLNCVVTRAYRASQLAHWSHFFNFRKFLKIL